MAVTHWLNGVPSCPGTCFLGSVRQYHPYAFPCGAALEAPVGSVAPVAPDAPRRGRFGWLLDSANADVEPIPRATRTDTSAIDLTRAVSD